MRVVFIRWASAIWLRPEPPHRIHDVMATSLYDIRRDKTPFGMERAMQPPT